MSRAPFTRVAGVAAALREENIDTDIIFPARFLLMTAREGLGDYAFRDWRLDGNGEEIDQFILNHPHWRDAPILVTGANFGCGSSREQAVWALLDAGVRCIIAPSFGEIFESNCIRNGLLPIELDVEKILRLMDAADAGQSLTIDLEASCIAAANGTLHPFAIREEWRQALLHGWDETATILSQWHDAIARFEITQKEAQPWLYARPNQQGAGQ